MSLTALDIVFIILIALFTLRCLLKGFIHEFFSIAAIVLGLIASLYFYKNGGAFIRNRFMPEVKTIPEILAFIALFVIVFFAMKILEFLLKDIVEGIELGGVDRFLGIIFGLIEGMVVVSLILFIISIQPLFDPSSLLADSLFARALLPLIRGTPLVLGGTPPAFGGDPCRKCFAFSAWSLHAVQTPYHYSRSFAVSKTPSYPAQPDSRTPPAFGGTLCRKCFAFSAWSLHAVQTPYHYSRSFAVSKTPSYPAQPDSRTPPAFGGTPPVLGGTPPAFGGTPPVLGGTPPVLGGTPPVLGGTPPVSGGTPPVSGGTPPVLGGDPCRKCFAFSAWSFAKQSSLPYCVQTPYHYSRSFAVSKTPSYPAQPDSRTPPVSGGREALLRV